MSAALASRAADRLEDAAGALVALEQALIGFDGAATVRRITEVLAAGAERYPRLAETADTLRTLARIRGTLQAFEPPGFAAALWRAVLLAVYGVIEMFVVIDDERNADRCFELLDTAEAMADRFAGKA